MSKNILTALPAIYDAATSEDKWPEALDELVCAVGARGAVLAVNDLVGLPFQVQSSSSLYRVEDLEHYFARFAQYEMKGIELLSRCPARTLCRDVDVWPDPSETAEREDFVYLRNRYGIENRVAISLSKGKGWSDTLYLQTGKTWAQMPEAFDDDVQALLPHVAKVVEINRTFTLLRLRYQAALAALDFVGIGMCIASDEGEIILANEEARRIFAEGDGLTLGRNGRLVARDENLSREIRAGIELTAQTAAGKGEREEIAIVCPRAAPSSPLLVEICPLRDGAAELQRRFLGSLVCIIDPDGTRDLCSDGLARLFALSPAEVVVCEELLRGRTARDIAEIRGVSTDTVRSQIKALYTKTGVANRVGLIRLAIAANPPIR